MCSVEEDLVELSQFNDVNRIKITQLSHCKKCGENTDVVLRKKDPLCRTCFLSYCTHKFRATIGKSREVKPGDKILLAFSGGICSSSMLHMVQQSLAEVSHKRLLIDVGLLYIDDGAIRKISAKERERHCKEIWHLITALGFPLYVTSLEMAFQDEPGENFYLLLEKNISLLPLITNKWVTSLTDSLASFSTTTAKEDYIRCLRNKLLADVAKSTGYNKIFVGDTSTVLSAKLLSSIAQGRGAQLPSDIGFVDNRYSVPILRPLREFLTSEIMKYNEFNDVHCIILPSSDTKVDTTLSIAGLTEKFVAGLQEDFPATISTIMRTGDKLRSAIDPALSEAECVLCQSPLDTLKPDPCSALEALKVSESVSKKFTNEPSVIEAVDKKFCCSEASEGLKHQNMCCCDDTSGCKKEQSVSFVRSDLTPHMCHGCQLIIKDMTQLELLPTYVLNKTQRLSLRAKMKQEIEDYLIEDD